MSLAADLIETYDTVLGHEPSGMGKIAPAAHHYFSTRQVIDIQITKQGTFVDAVLQEKCSEKTLLAVTEESASRTSSAAAETPHALNDNLMFMTSKHNLTSQKEPDSTPRNCSYKAYLSQLERWAKEPGTPVSVKAVYQYLEHHDPIDDMLAGGKFPKEKSGVFDISKYLKYTVRWKVVSDKTAEVSETWTDPDVLASWTTYYSELHGRKYRQELDAITGRYGDIEKLHPKPVSAYGNSKLISTATKEDSTLHFKGERFNQADQILQIGFLSSQKMHNALSWLVETQGIPISKNALPWLSSSEKPRYIVCWEPHYDSAKRADAEFLENMFKCCMIDSASQYQSVKDQLAKKLYSLTQEDVSGRKVSIFMLDRSGDGRLSPVMYRSFTVKDFMRKLNEWQKKCCWYFYDPQARQREIRSPSLFDLAKCAFGVERISEKDTAYLDVNDSVFKNTIRMLLMSVLDGRKIPDSFVRRITVQASSPERFSGTHGYNWELILATACAVIHEKHLEMKKGEKDLELDKDNTNRSYLFGRFLAVADRIENQALNRKESMKGEDKSDHRDTNAMRLWSAYAAHPFSCCSNLRKCIAPYLASLPYGSRKFYEDEMQEIVTKLDMDDKRLNHPLEPEYLIGFYHERAALWSSGRGKQNTEEEVMTNVLKKED